METKWTKELLTKEALKYERRIDFNNGSGVAYKLAGKLGIRDEICSHMTKRGEGWTKDMF